MNCELVKKNYEITLVQGDYGSYLYKITNCDGSPIENVSSAVFTCSKLGVEKDLIKLNDTDFSLILEPTQTKQFIPCECTYDITITIGDENKLYTIIRSAVLTILEKENPLSG